VIAVHEHTVRHESAHAAAAALLGVLPTAIEVGSYPGGGGWTWLRLGGSSPASERRWAQILLAGWIGNDEDPPRWPSEQAPKGTDEHKLAMLARHLDLDRAAYAALVREAWELAVRPEFTLLEHGFRTALSFRRFLDAVTVSKVLIAALGHQRAAALYGVTQKEEDEQ
jgi:hypothetical protein